MLLERDSSQSPPGIARRPSGARCRRLNPWAMPVLGAFPAISLTSLKVGIVNPIL